jgi:hypothetical protein
LMEELQSLRSFPTWAGVLGYNNIIRVGTELFFALCQVQNEIATDGELRFLELLQAGVYSVCIAMDEKNTKGTAPVRSCALRMETLQIRLDFVLRQV